MQPVSQHLIGIFNSEAGGQVAECGQCGQKVNRSSPGKIKNWMRTHYAAQHPEHSIRFARYTWNA
jgi:hypothetical protein